MNDIYLNMSPMESVIYLVFIFTISLFLFHGISAPLTPRFSKKYFKIVYVFSIVTFSFLLYVLDRYILNVTYVLVNLRLLIIFLVLILMLKFLYKDNFIKISACTTIVIAINMITSIMGYSLGMFIWGQSVIQSKILSMQIYMVSVVSIGLMSILLFFNTRFLKKIPPNVSNKHWFILGVIEFSLVYVANMILETNQLNIQIYLVITLFLILIVSIFSMVMFSSITQFYTKENEHLLLKIQSDALLAQIEVEKQQFTNLKHFRHETNSLLTSLYVLAENNESQKITEIISEKLKALQEKEEKILTGNALLDAMLNLKIAEIHMVQIPLTTELAHLNIELPFSPPDLCSILMNLLENAIDASKVVIEKGKKPFIFIKICIYKNHLSIIVKNAYDGEICLKGTELKTTKGDTSLHGYGIKNTIQFINKYDGLFDYDYAQHIFTVKVMLPLNMD